MTVVVEDAECLASVPMASGLVMSLVKLGSETITANLLSSRERLERGECYRVIFEKIERIKS